MSALYGISLTNMTMLYAIPPETQHSLHTSVMYSPLSFMGSFWRLSVLEVMGGMGACLRPAPLVCIPFLIPNFLIPLVSPLVLGVDTSFAAEVTGGG